MSEVKFSELGLLEEMQRAIDELGFETATDIQAEAIPAVREGRDVIGKSQTGTGKTLAFAIPAIEKIDRSEAETSVQVLILCPTRELAQQGADERQRRHLDHVFALLCGHAPTSPASGWIILSIISQKAGAFKRCVHKHHLSLTPRGL